MSHFCLLSKPDQYVAHDWDMLTDVAARNHWLELFDKHFQEVLKSASTQYGRTSGKQVMTARAEFAEVIKGLRENPAGLPSGKLNIIELCRAREAVLRKHRLNDPFGHIKKRENELAASIYPAAVKKLHAMEGPAKWLHLIECVFAGNLFDLGAPMVMHMADKPMDFLSAVENTKPRPWLIDDFDTLLKDLPSTPPVKWAKAVVFIDNAGSDFILGIMPLVRELALSGTKIVLAANELPSLNDMTADETVAVVERLAAVDADLAALLQADMFEVVSTGNDIPLIDLSNVSDELNAAAADADLVIIEGMGRAVESNLDAQFKVDTLWLALLKDTAVAERVNGQVYDCICKYKPV
ncbi:MAG: DUF89 family protein [Planctomycetaceae bacterium]|nr:MAG: DUF89 family protein [Planctomycetaceae bacterium]